MVHYSTRKKVLEEKVCNFLLNLELVAGDTDRIRCDRSFFFLAANIAHFTLVSRFAFENVIFWGVSPFLEQGSLADSSGSSMPLPAWAVG